MKRYKQLTYSDMVKIETLLKEGKRPIEIALKIGKSKTTIYRCIEKNSDDKGFYAEKAWEKVREKKSRANTHIRILSDSLLEEFICEKIESYWSPEQIAGRWKRDVGEALSHETIYKYIYDKKPGLIRIYLRRKGKKYQKDRGKPHELKEMRLIDERPKDVAGRREIGHWEGDTITDGSLIRGIVTNVERKSGLLLASKVDRRNSEEVSTVTIEDFTGLPDEIRLSITYDQGSEFGWHKIIEYFTKMTVYFAHAHCPWERGTNENTNGLLRQFIPKGTSLDQVTEKDLQHYVSLLNNRPRKRLNYQTPYEVFQKELKSCT